MKLFEIFQIYQIYLQNARIVFPFPNSSPFIHSNSPVGNGWLIAYPYKLFTPKYTLYLDGLLASYFAPMYLLLDFPYLVQIMETHHLIPFSIINNISGSVSNSNSTPVTFSAASQANPGAV